MQTLTLEQLRATTAAGGVTGVTLKAQGGVFYVAVTTRAGKAVLVLTRSKEPRGFADPRKAMELLRGVGIATGDFDITQWNPKQGSLRPSRPDAARAMKNAHSARKQQNA
ncbi:hypothetical protein SIL79_20570 [Shewanella indica]|uniref:DUF4102 domain-containing protein n=1 Tax=Shewanella indica TaxID=768528 RepID=A0ABU4QIF6_9GAMM|nr:hypothetical protein [Shewanella indica]MDX6018607.1 hypothetical protein [Shewanella indica]MDX6018666.1 hypothetical protein [Shewanella indica]